VSAKLANENAALSAAGLGTGLRQKTLPANASSALVLNKKRAPDTSIKIKYSCY